MSRPICLRGGRVVDPSRGIDRIQDLWLDQGRIAGLGEDAIWQAWTRGEREQVIERALRGVQRAGGRMDLR